MDFGKKKRKRTQESTVTPTNFVIGDTVTQAEPDYTYDQLVSPFYATRCAPSRHVLVLQPPNVQRCGSARTLFSNFATVCQQLGRSPKHVMAFALDELGAVGSFLPDGALSLKGRFQIRHIETIIKAYVKEYVACKSCKGTSTVIERDHRITVVRCNDCFSKTTVPNTPVGGGKRVKNSN